MRGDKGEEEYKGKGSEEIERENILVFKSLFYFNI